MTTLEQLPAAPVHLQKLVKRFGHARRGAKAVVAVDHIDLEIETGKLVTLLGPSGCGKTTTLRLIAGLERPDEGHIFLDHEDVTRQPAYLRDVTMVFQSYALFPHMSVFENVAYGLRVTRRPAEELNRRVGEALEMVGLEGLGARAPSALSGGQQQRVALARALVMQPKVLLFDEPLSNLDAKLRKRVREEIRQLQQRLGITSVYVTHDQEEALAISDQIVVMNGGKIEQIGTPHGLYAAPASRFVADFIGSANFLRGHFGGAQVTLGAYSFAHTQEVPKGPVTVMVRPEAVQFTQGGAGLAAKVVSAAYLGSATEYLFETSVGEVAAVMSGEGMSLARQGDDVQLTFKPAGIYLLPADEPEASPAANTP